MKRELKFRAWDLNEDEYIPWEHLIQVCYNQDFYKTKDQSAPILSALTDKYLVLEQFTGLRDSKGVDVYEGDILHTDEAGWIAKVIWHYDGFMLTGLDNTGFSLSPSYDKCEVIGTIHDAEYKELAK